jgi:signal transduction histidine kinase
MPSRPPSDGRAALARLCSHLQESADAEKRRLARALHDSPAQTVSAALLTLFLLEREKSSLSPSAQRALEDAQSLLAACGEDLRQMSHELFPPLLDEVGLQPPLRALVRRSGDRLHLRLPEDLPRLPRRTEEAAYRFVEEALTSVLARKTKAKSPVELDLSLAGGRTLSVTLEGRGRAAKDAAVAMMALRQRVTGAGGELVVARRRGRLRLEARFRAARSGQKKLKIAAPGVSGDRGTAPTGGSVKRQRLQQKDAPAGRRQPLVKDPAAQRNNT